MQGGIGGYASEKFFNLTRLNKKIKFREIRCNFAVTFRLYINALNHDLWVLIIFIFSKIKLQSQTANPLLLIISTHYWGNVPAGVVGEA
jgi:hypothetical protein